MKIEKLVLHNWMGFKGTHEIELGDKDVIGVIAEYADDKEASNQGGKTSIVESILYGLTGNSRASKETELIHYGEEVMWVEIHLTGDRKIRRGRDHKNKGVLELDWIEKSPEAQKEIDKLIGFSSKDFELITYFKQAEITQFMDMTSAKKKEYIVQWFDLGHWEKLEKAVKADITELKSEHKTVSAKIEALEETFDNDVDLDTEKEVLEDSLKTTEKKIVNTKKKLKQYKAKNKVSEADYLKAKSTFKKAKLRIEECEKNIAQNKQYQLAIKKTQKKADTIKAKIEMDVSTAHQGVARCMSRIEELDKKIKLAEKHKSGLCPILSEPCDRIKFDKKTLSDWEAQVSLLKQDEEDYREQISLNMEEGEYLAKIQKIKARIKDDYWGDFIADAQSAMDDSKDIIDSYDKNAEAKVEQLEELLEDLDFEKNNLKGSIGSINAKIEAKEKNAKRIKKLKSDLKKIATELDHKNYLAMMFGKNGIPSLEIENGFGEVEEEANFSLEQFNPNMEISFKPTRELGVPEPLCLSCGHQFKKGSAKNADCPSCGTPRRMKQKDEIQFSVSQNGQDYAYYMDSGGGKSILSLCVRIALTMLKRRLGGANLNVVFLDEPDSALDKRYLRNFVQFVTKTLTKKLGIEQVIWISHHKEIQNQVPHTLKVIKDGNEAKTTWS
jgi:DNA repair exonuclease SbcCD ATPase subunit